jgi:hypothetical protein
MDKNKNFTNGSTLNEIFESAGYKINSAEVATYNLLDKLKNPETNREDAFEIINALGVLVGEISAQVNGYFDDNEEDYQFCDFIR